MAERKKEAPSPVRIVGAPRRELRDAYHYLLQRPWWVALALIILAFLLLNAGFALLYLLTGGIANAREGSFIDAFFFSVQTMGTIGYGSMYPNNFAANILVVAEAVCGLVVTAVATGLVFAKFSQSTARIVFTDQVTIHLMDGTPTLSFRLGNQRGNQIVEAQLRVHMIRTEKTAEGVLFYRMYDLPLTRDRSPAFSRSWTVMHRITPDSLLYGETPESLARSEAEFVMTVIGTDDTSLQPVHARREYTHRDIVWGARHVDILSEEGDGTIVLDLRRFHDTVATMATETFPYPDGSRAMGGESSV
ncbi:MAG: ion channel [Polyangiaceae bacterium]